MKTTQKRQTKQEKQAAAIARARDFAIRFGKKYKNMLSKLSWE